MTHLRSRIHLEEIAEGLQLNFQKIRIRHMLLHCREIDSLVLFLICHLILWFYMFQKINYLIINYLDLNKWFCYLTTLTITAQYLPEFNFFSTLCPIQRKRFRPLLGSKPSIIKQVLLLQLYLSTYLLKSFLESLSSSFVYTFLNVCRSSINDVLSFLQTKTCLLFNSLNYLELISTS